MFQQTNNETFNRPPRLQHPQIVGEIDIPAPPTDSEETARSLLISLLPMAGVLLMAFFFMLTGGGGRGILMVVPLLGMSGVSVLAGLLTFSYQKQQQRQRKIRILRDYHRLLDKRAARLQAGIDLQRHLDALNFPPPNQLIDYIYKQHPALWNRRASDMDFSALRLGSGIVPSRVQVGLPDPDLNAQAIRRAMDLSFYFQQVQDAPVILNLRESGSLGIVGDRRGALSYMYALIGQLVTFHSPTDLRMFVFASRTNYRAWNWARWLPHMSSAYAGGFPDQISYYEDNSHHLLSQLAQIIETRQDQQSPTEHHELIIVVVDNPNFLRDEPNTINIFKASHLGIIVLFLADNVKNVPSDCKGVIELKPEDKFEGYLTGLNNTNLTGKADYLDRASIELLARSLANLQIPAAQGSQRIPTSAYFLQMYGVETIGELNIRQKWVEDWKLRLKDDPLPFAVPIGNINFSEQLYIDLSEQVHGPHGMVAGTTGSGKSELLQTLVMALAVDHHPHFLNFLLIDFKGGSTFDLFQNLPHTVGLITNLSDPNTGTSPRIEALRTLEAIRSENDRRQLFLKRKGFKDITAYHKQLSQIGIFPPDWEPLPHLLIIIDEFAELATELPNFIPELVSTVRVGRSLGMHLILATQRPSNYVTSEMRANLQFRICLRVQSPEDSREMLQSPEAAYLPTGIAGRGYFQAGTTGSQQFQVARVSTDYTPEMENESTAEKTFEFQLIHYEQPQNLKSDASSSRKDTNVQKPLTLAQKLVERMASLYTDIRLPQPEPILLPSLPAQIPVSAIIRNPSWNIQTKQWQTVDSSFTVPFGQVDNVSDHRVEPLVFDLAGNDGHLMIMGVPGCGKTTALRTIVISTALTCRPDQITLYLLSFAGHTLDALAALPHVSAVINSDEQERVSRLISHLLTQLDERGRSFAQVGAENLAQYNHIVSDRLSQGMDRYQTLPLILVMIDNFIEIKNTFPEAVMDVARLIREGRAFGIHFVITATQSADVPNQIQNLIDKRIALRLPEKIDYLTFVGAIGERELNPRPGSGVMQHSPPLHVQIALPIAGSNDKERADTLEDLIKTMNEAAKDGKLSSAAMPIRTLPVDVLLDSEELITSKLPRQPGSGTQFDELSAPIGLLGETLKAKVLYWGAEGPHFLITGPARTGKTTLLKTLLLSVAEHYSPQELQIFLIDFGNSALRMLRYLPHVTAYARDEADMQAYLAYLYKVMNDRRKLAQQYEKENDTFENAGMSSMAFCPIVLAIDDYDQLRDALRPDQQKMLDDLAFLIRRGNELNFHLLVAGETGNMNRSDMLLKQLKLNRSGFALASAEAVVVLGGRDSAAMRREQLPVGRGYQIAHNKMEQLQFARVLDERNSIDAIRQKWSNCPASRWEVSIRDNDFIPPSESPLDNSSHPLDLSSESMMNDLLTDYIEQQGYPIKPEIEPTKNTPETKSSE